MKKILAIALGLGIAFGTLSIAQDKMDGGKKMEGDKKADKKKSDKKADKMDKADDHSKMDHKK